MVTALKSGNAVLSLHTDINGWCAVQLQVNDHVLQLGADVETVIAQRLRHVLEDAFEGDIVGSIGGIDVVWALSLSERHCSIYMGENDSRRILFFQGEDGALLARIELDSIERREWLGTLSSFSSTS